MIMPTTPPRRILAQNQPDIFLRKTRLASSYPSFDTVILHGSALRLRITVVGVMALAGTMDLPQLTLTDAPTGLEFTGTACVVPSTIDAHPDALTIVSSRMIETQARMRSLLFVNVRFSGNVTLSRDLEA